MAFRRMWRESEHPRDSQGRFIEVGSRVTAAGGVLGGIVERIERGATTGGGPLIHFRETQVNRGGRMLEMLPERLTVEPGPDPGDIGYQSYFGSPDVSGVSSKQSEESWVKRLVARMRRDDSEDEGRGGRLNEGFLRDTGEMDERTNIYGFPDDSRGEPGVKEPSASDLLKGDYTNGDFEVWDPGMEEWGDPHNIYLINDEDYGDRVVVEGGVSFMIEPDEPIRIRRKRA